MILSDQSKRLFIVIHEIDIDFTTSCYYYFIFTSTRMKIISKMGAAISTTQFYLYGRKNFTQTGYLKHLAKYTLPVQDSPAIGIGQEGADGVNLTDKVVVITGANSGIGKDVATYAAAKSAKVYMFCRSKDRAEKARKEIVEATKNDSVEIILIDLVSSLQ